MLLALFQTLPHNPIKNPPRLSNQLVQLLAELLALMCVLFLLILLALESGSNDLENLDGFFTQLVTGVFDELLHIFFNPLSDRGERTVETRNFVFEIGVADMFQRLA